MVLDDWSKAKDQLAKVKQVYQLETEPPVLEVGYYLLLATHFYQHHYFKEVEEIRQHYLSGVAKVLPMQQEQVAHHRYYAYFCVKKAMYQRACHEAVFHLEKIMAEPSVNPLIHRYLMSELIFCYKRFGYDEKAMMLIQEVKELLLVLAVKQQKIAVKLLCWNSFFSAG